jgi:hypothetical protein
MRKISQNPRVLCDGMKGQNYWFNGCMEYLMECLGESKEYDYWFFSGITGDSFIQMYSKDISNMVLCYSHNLLKNVIKTVFDSCGYNYDYFNKITGKDHIFYDNKIKEYINRGIPVIAKIKYQGEIKYKKYWCSYCIIYGYENDKYFCINGDNPEEIICSDQYFGLIFVKDKKTGKNFSESYKHVVMNIPSYIKMPETKEYSFGRQAFMDWGNSFQNGTFDGIPIKNNEIWYTHFAEGFSCWNMHGTYLCILGTNACCTGFLEKALYYNHEMDFIKELIPIYEKINRDGFHKLIGMQEGFSIKPETIKNKTLMEPISEQIKKLALLNDNIIEIYKKKK